MSMITRRDFTKAAAMIGVAAAVGTRAAASNAPPSERIRVGFIGVGNRGDQVLNAFMAQEDVEVVAVCDVYRPYVQFAAGKVGENCGKYRDYRYMLDRDDIDAVVINTPDHWHALQTIHACQAGKDVYVEKPLSLTVAEGRAMVNAARRYKRVSQVGIQRRSSQLCQEVADLIQSDAIGKVTVIRAFHVQNEWPLGIGRPSDTDSPDDLDWDLWVGPAPYKPYNENRTLYRFRWFYDYSGGQVTNMGTHYMDMVNWALNREAPRSVTALGGKFGDFDNREIPDTLEVLWTYDTGTLVTFSQFNATSAPAAARNCQMEFRGTKGTLYLHGDSYTIEPENVPGREFPVLTPLDRKGPRNWRSGEPMIEPRENRGPGDTTTAHVRDFLDCVKTRERCRCDMEIGHRATSATLIANIAHRTKSVLEWDAKAERFTNNKSANAMLSYRYRRPYVLPRV